MRRMQRGRLPPALPLEQDVQGLDLRVGYHYLIDQNKPINAPDATSQGMQLFGGVAFKLRFGTN